MRLSEVTTFLRQTREAYRTTGSIAPSSRSLARAITRPLARRAAPSKVLEVGPGTGALTRRIVSLLRDGEELVLYEINPAFCDYLRSGLNGANMFPRRRAKVDVVQAPIQSIAREPVFDYVVSSIPFNNFSPETVREMLEAMLAALKPGGYLSYFECAWMRDLKIALSEPEVSRRVAGVKRVIGEFLARYQVDASVVYLNLPPAYVRHLRKP